MRKKIWFNKTFSSVHAAIELIRRGDVAGEYQLIYTCPNPHAAAFMVADAHFLEPSGLGSEEYLAWCLGFCLEQAIDIFVPGKEAIQISRHIAEFAAAGTRVLSAGSTENLELLNDKAHFYATAVSSHVPAPECVVFDDSKSFNLAYKQLRERFPVLCMKPASSVYGIGFRKILEDRLAFDLLLGADPYRTDLQSLQEMLARAGKIRPMLLMPYLEGPEFSVDCVASQGRLLCAVARQKGCSSGAGQEIVVRADIQGACEDLIRQYALNGNINIQFRDSHEGLRILEINPRMSGGIGMACQAGPNLPYLALKSFDQGDEALQIPSIQAGLRVGEVSYAVSLP